jgi:hypothetical protein
VNRGPSHAGKLPAWERVVFALVFALMAAFVVAVTVSAAHSNRGGLPPGAGLPDSVASAGTASDGGASDGSAPSGVAANGGGPAAAGSGHVMSDRSRAILDKKLARALRAQEGGHLGHLAVGVIDLGTGAEAAYGVRRKFAAASLMRADLLAALLLRHQEAGTALTDPEAQLAVPMIETSDDKAASRLWQLIGAGPAVAAANRRLGLSHTIPDPGGKWGGSRTTVTDQLRLLTDLTATTSPLTAPSRDYELGLMEDVQPGQDWGVCAVASPGTGCAVKDGWRPDQALWVVNSIGVVEHAGHRLLVAVLSDHAATKAAGIARVSAAVRAAAQVMTADS